MKQKFRKYYLVVSKMILKKRKANTIEKARRAALLRQVLFQKQLVQKELFR